MKLDFDKQVKEVRVEAEEEEQPIPATKEAIPVSSPTVLCGPARAEIQDNYIGIDWAFISKCGNVQFSFAMLNQIAALLYMMNINTNAMSFFRFTTSAWSTYLLATAYVAIRAARCNSYAHIVAYAGMVTFQTVLYMSSLAWFVYSFYAIEYEALHYRQTYNISSYMMILMLIEGITMIGTMFTGLFGMLATCRGLGKILHQMETMIMASRYREPVISVQPLV